MTRAIYFTILITFLFSSAIAQSAAGSKFIGYKYESPDVGKKLPNGFTHNGGGLIGDIDADPVYGVSVLEKGKTKMFWLEVSTARNNNGGVTTWEVKDVLEFSSLGPKDFVLEFSDPTFECKRGGTGLEHVVGVGAFNRKSGVFVPRKLWLPNAKTAKFESVPVRNVRCLYSEP